MIQALDITANATVSRLENPVTVNSMCFSTSTVGSSTIIMSVYDFLSLTLPLSNSMSKDLGAITGRDGILRVFSPRTGSLVGCNSTSGSVDTRGGPRQQCSWWGRAGMDFIITTGFGAPSQQRRVYLWSVLNFRIYNPCFSDERVLCVVKYLILHFDFTANKKTFFFYLSHFFFSFFRL